MRTGVSGFQPKRLIQARESIGITRVALAGLIGVSPATVTNWEKGTQSPEEDKLRALSNCFNFSKNWFLNTVPSQGDTPYFFRSLSSSTKIAREMAKVRLNWVREITSYLEQWVDWPEVNIPSIRENSFLTVTDSEIEALTLQCRQEWKLGLGPIKDMVLTLENSGAIFSNDEIGYLKMDAVSQWCEIDNRPYVFAVTDKANSIRSRFDVAHELGHLVLHKGVDEKAFKKNYKEIERQADYFASCLLLPAETFSAEINWPTLESLLSMKSRWKVSVAAMVMRCHQLGIIDDDQKMRLFKGRSARGWVKGEPYDDAFPREKSRLLNRSVNILINNNIVKKEDISYTLGLSESLIESLCDLPKGFLSSEPSHNLVELKSIVKKNSQHKKNYDNKILNFPNKNNR